MTVFNLGQHCERRVSLFHAFTHWEFALFQVIEEKVTAVETRNREKMKKKKKKKRLIDTADPDNILDWLEKKDVVAQVIYLVLASEKKYLIIFISNGESYRS
jgi:hypothetical protein